MTETMTKKLLAECVRLNKAAVVDVSRARELLGDAEISHSQNFANIKSQEATAVALLAIEARLAMVALFVIAAMEEDDHATD